MGTGHAHAIPDTQNAKFLWWALGRLPITEVIGGLILNSPNIPCRVTALVSD
jgi:hypothetical protein